MTHYGFAQVPRLVIRGESYKKLSLIEKGLYTCLKDICGDEGECFYTLRALAEEIHTSISTLSRYIPKLIERGLIAAYKRCRAIGKTKHEVWHIRIVNIWQANDAIYGPERPSISKGNTSLSVADRNVSVAQGNKTVADRNKVSGDQAQDCFYLNDRRREEDSSKKNHKEECVLPSYAKGYKGTPSPDAHMHTETASHIAIDASKWLQEQDQAIDENNDALNERWREERDLGTFFADRNGSYEPEHDEEETQGEHDEQLVSRYSHSDGMQPDIDGPQYLHPESNDSIPQGNQSKEALEQMSTEHVDKQASTVDNDKPSNGGVTQESEGTNGHPTALYPSGQHSNLIDHQHDSAHQDHGDTRLETATQRMEVGTGTGTPSRINTDLWQEDGAKPASEGVRAVAQKDAERIAEEVRAQCVAPSMVASIDAQSHQIQAPIKETAKAKDRQKDIPSRAQKVGNGGKKSAIPEPSAEAKVVIERWQAVFWQLFQKRILVNASMIEAAELLAPLDLSVEELIDLRAFGFRSNPEWYRRVGMCLMDCYKNVEKWRSLQGETSGIAHKEEDADTFYGYPIITEAWMERRRVSA